MKNFLIKLFSKAGYQVINKSKINFAVGNFQYQSIITNANYAPWLQDAEFDNAYQKIKNHTLVDIYRCYELWQLVEEVHALNDKASFLEVGVWKGGTSGIIGKKLALLNSTASFYLADTFSGVVKASEKDEFYKGGEHADTTIDTVQTLMKNIYSNYKILQGVFPNDTAVTINEDEKFGLCHIDVDVYQSAKEIVDWVWDRLIIGGMIVFDDYGFHTTTGVTKYVNDRKNMSNSVIIYNLNGHAIMIKVK